MRATLDPRALRMRWSRRWRAATRIALVAGVALAGCAASPSEEESSDEESLTEKLTPPEQREKVVGAMRAEMQRGMENLTLEGYPSPYFLAYQVKDTRIVTLSGRFGALDDVSDDRYRQIYAEVRVGSYQFDNYANVPVHNFRLSPFQPSHRAPLETDVRAIRGALWLLTDDNYKKALSDYLSKKGGAVYETEEKIDVASFSKEKPRKHRGPVEPISFDRKKWQATIKAVSDRMTRRDEILDSNAEMRITRTVRYLVNSEGTDIVDEQMLYTVHFTAQARAEDGMLLDNGRQFYARSAAELPSRKELLSEADAMLDDLVALRDAPVIDPYTGPAILMPRAAGVLFHEAVGHRLEGERQRDEQEGRTFKGRIGKKVLPTFISVYDDPTRAAIDDKQLNGTYRFDDEGVPAQRVTLVEDGVLRNFLKSRTPIEGSPKSNGHGRAQGVAKPMARMGNLIVRASDDKSVPYAELKEKLLAEVRRQGKPFGLIIKDITGGSTNTSGFGYQAFKGVPRMVYKVDPKTGDETLVRGVELVGTPLASINKLMASSDELGVFNGYCGAESGYVPVSAVAPAMLTSEIELQRSQTAKERKPVLEAPWSAENRAGDEEKNGEGAPKDGGEESTDGSSDVAATTEEE